MKNLNIAQTLKAQLEATIVGQCIDADNRRFFLLTDDVKIYEIQGDKRSVHPVEITSESRGSIGITSIEREDVIAIEYIVEHGSICIVLKNGQFIRVGVSSFSPPSGCIYTHSKQLCSVKLSPDQDLIALADIDNDLFILTADFSVVHSSNALTHSDSVHKPVGVGWGSKETQFFGLDGRPSKEKSSKDQVVLGQEELAAIETIESSEHYTHFRRDNERSTVVDWRGDGQLLATFTIIPDSGKHYLKVWNRNLELQYMSEQLVTMERGLLSWVPNGQYVCTAQRRDNRINEIAMFEKNGMVHQRITLPTFIPHLYIKNLLWSPDSAILAIVVVQFDIVQSQVQQRHMILLYTMQNFHYYLKYSSYLTLGGNQYTAINMRWNPNHNSILYIASENGICLEYNCTQLIDYWQEDTTVAVIDANKILLTPFALCNIPPPMSAISMELETLVSRLVMQSQISDQMLIITQDNKIIYRSLDKQVVKNELVKVLDKIGTGSVCAFSQRLGAFKQVDFKQSHEYQNLTLVDRFSAIASRRTKVGHEVVKLQIDDNLETPILKIESLTVLDGLEVVSVVRDSFTSSSDSILLLLDDFSCTRVSLTSGETSARFTIKNAGDRLYVKDSQYIKAFDLVVTLTLDLTLRANDNVIASNCCTSFRTTPNFIIFTSIDHMIHFIPLDKLTATPLQEEIGSWNQPIENGGTLVIASESDSKVILQMPRGNLEILHPRIMVLLRITDHLNIGEYLAALKLARRYRVDLNFLVDYMLSVDEQVFYGKKLANFANDLTRYDPTLLNLFIAELTSDDTTCDRYRSAMRFMPASSQLSSIGEKSVSREGKVNEICAVIRQALDSQYLQPILLCLLKQEPRRSDEALKLIHKLATKEDREAALKFMLYFISIEQLFSDAIATYDTDIAVMVASVSSKDPKEYLALLDGFKEIEDIHLRKYKMDFHIKNYERAFTNLLVHLQDAPNKDEIKTNLLDMVKAKRIYRHAVRSCFDEFVNFVSLGGECRVDKTFQQLSMEIWSLYGDYLLEKRHYLEAGLAYLKSLALFATDKKLENAIKCFLLANDWERCVAAIERHKLSCPGFKSADVLKNISNNLMLQGDFAEAILLLEPPKSDELAFDLVGKGRWYLAELIVSEKSRLWLREEISRSVNSDYDIQLSSLTKELSVVGEQYKRFEQLMLSPPKANHFDAENCYTADSLSTVDGSETTSVLSERNTQKRVARSGAPSIKTRVSSKSNKSQAAKRKKINLKLGSRHEDMALAMELQKFVSRQKSNQESVRSLIAAQIEYMDLISLDKRHESINELLKQNHTLARQILENLWPKTDQADSTCSVYRRFGKALSTCEDVDNIDLQVLLRPELPESCLLLEF